MLIPANNIRWSLKNRVLNHSSQPADSPDLTITGPASAIVAAVVGRHTPARSYDEVAATKTMIQRTQERLRLKPERIAGDTAYGTGRLLDWLVEQNIAPHIPVWDKSKRDDGTLSRTDFSFDKEHDVYICPMGKRLKMLPQLEHVEAILDFGRSLTSEAIAREQAHLLVHCHMGVSRSTAAMAMLMAQSNPKESEEQVFARLLELRPQAWPNSLMVEFADDQLGRRGRLLTALGGLYAQQLAKRPETEQFMRTHGRRREVEMAWQA